MSVLRRADEAFIDEQKFTGYCLNPSHELGKHKARVFLAALGYDLSNYSDLIEQIQSKILQSDAIGPNMNRYGESWTVDVYIVGPTGAANVRTAWQYRKDEDFPRLVSVHKRQEIEIINRIALFF